MLRECGLLAFTTSQDVIDSETSILAQPLINHIRQTAASLRGLVNIALFLSLFRNIKHSSHANLLVRINSKYHSEKG